LGPASSLPSELAAAADRDTSCPCTSTMPAATSDARDPLRTPLIATAGCDNRRRHNCLLVQPATTLGICSHACVPPCHTVEHTAPPAAYLDAGGQVCHLLAGRLHALRHHR
jgi:hypothetical protein